MNATTRRLVSFILFFSFCFFFAGQEAPAQGNCLSVRGQLNDVSTPDGVIGVLSQAGILNGTYALLNHAGPAVTPDANTISYTLDFVISTTQGQLRASDVGIFDFVTGVFSEISRIDPNTSSGRFAGATGTLYTNGKTTDGGATFQSTISGEICFANQ